MHVVYVMISPATKRFTLFSLFVSLCCFVFGAQDAALALHANFCRFIVFSLIHAAVRKLEIAFVPVFSRDVFFIKLLWQNENFIIFHNNFFFKFSRTCCTYVSYFY